MNISNCVPHVYFLNPPKPANFYTESVHLLPGITHSKKKSTD